MEVKPGYKQTEFGVIPEEWEVQQLRTMKFDISDGNYSSKYPKASDFRPFGVPFIRANNIRGLTVVDDDMRFISAAQHQELQKGHLKANDILITTRGDIGQVALVPERHVDSNINAQLVRINTDSTSVDHRFLVYAISSGHGQDQLNNLQTGSALKQLPVGRLIQLNLAFPSSTEQRAIAEALSDVDGLLGGLDRLIAKKRDVKQAAMQQLLTGQTRLPGFHGEWELKRIDRIAPLQRGFDLPNSKLQRGPYPVVYSNGILNHHSDWQVEGPGVVTGRSGTIGKVTFVGGAYWPHNTSLWVTSFQGNDPKFVFYLYSMVGFERFATGSGVPTLNRNDVHAFEVLIPPTSSEQTAIAEVLTDIDTDLAGLEQRRDKTRALKQAMMQELLTGKTRLV